MPDSIPIFVFISLLHAVYMLIDAFDILALDLFDLCGEDGHLKDIVLSYETLDFQHRALVLMP